MHQTREQIRVSIRWMIRRDLPDVLQIEADSFEHAWTEEDFLRCLRQRNCIGMVAEHGGRVVAYTLYELEKTHVRLVNFAVAADYRLRGVGRQLVAKLETKLSGHRRTRITLEVRDSNLPAQLFFKAMGFRAVRVLHNFYEDVRGDAYVMEYRVAGAADEGEPAAANRIAHYYED